MTTRNKGSLVWKILVSLALALVVLMIVAELGVRWVISNEMKKQVAQETSANAQDASIKFGPTPVLLSQLTKNVPHVEINTPSTLQIQQGNPPKTSGVPATQMEISDLNISDQNNPIAGHLVVHSQLPEDYLLAQIQASLAEQTANTKSKDITSQLISNLVKVTDLNTNQQTGNLEVVFTDGAAKLNLHPATQDGKVKFEAQGAELFGFELPKQATDSITKALEKQANEAGGKLRIDDFRVIDKALDVTFSGDDVPLNDQMAATKAS